MVAEPVSTLFSSVTQHPTQDLTWRQGGGARKWLWNDQQDERINRLVPWLLDS